MKLIKSFFCQEAGRTVVEVPEGERTVMAGRYFKEENLSTIGGNDHDRCSTYGSNSWMTLSNLKTEKSLVENAEERGESTRINVCFQY